MRSVPTEGRASWTRRVEDIGIAKDAKYESVREETLPTVFRPLAQNPLEDQAESFEVRIALPQGAIGRPSRTLRLRKPRNPYRNPHADGADIVHDARARARRALRILRRTGAAARDDRALRNAQLSGDPATPSGWQRSTSAFAWHWDRHDVCAAKRNASELVVIGEQQRAFPS